MPTRKQKGAATLWPPLGALNALHPSAPQPPVSFPSCWSAVLHLLALIALFVCTLLAEKAGASPLS